MLEGSGVLFFDLGECIGSKQADSQAENMAAAAAQISGSESVSTPSMS